MKKTVLLFFFLYVTLNTNSLQAMFNNKPQDEKQNNTNNENITLPTNAPDTIQNSDNKRINLEKQNNTNNKHIKINDDEKKIISYNNQLEKQTYKNKIINNEAIKKEQTTPTPPSSNVSLPEQSYQVCTHPQYNTNTHTTNNIVLNIQPTPILSFVPAYQVYTPLFIPTPQPILPNINIDQVKQFLANTQYLAQQKQPTYNEEIKYSNTYIFDLNEKNELKMNNMNIIKPIGIVKKVIFKILPSLNEINFLKKKFPNTQKIDASALFGERFSNIQANLNKKENIFYKLRDISEKIKEKCNKSNKFESFLLKDIKRNVLNFILKAYLKEPENPCDYINILLDYEEHSNTLIQNNLQYINNNNNTTQKLSQNSPTQTQNKPQLPIKKTPIQPSLQRTNNTPTNRPALQNFKRKPLQNIRSNSPFAENNNNSNNTPFRTDCFIDLILAEKNPIEDMLDSSSDTKRDLDFFYDNNTSDSTPINSNILDNSPYLITPNQNGFTFVFDKNEKKLLTQKIKLPDATNINALCFKICPTDLEFFELSEFFDNVQKIDLSFVLKTNKTHIKSILQSLKTFEHLKELKLEGNQLTDDIIIWIAKELPHLEALYLDHNFISDKGAEAISQLYDLQELSINSNHLTDHGAIKLAEMSNLITFHYDNNMTSEPGKKEIYAIRKEVSFLHSSN